MTKSKWTRTSASQHSAYQRCARRWYYGWIEKIKQPTSPAMQRGTDIHVEVENYLKTGKIRDAYYSDYKLNYRPYVESLSRVLPPPMHPDLLIEHPINLQCGPELPSWAGFIDIGYSGNEILEITDLKTTSDFRYAKTKEELKTNIQLISYAKWAFETTGSARPISVGHIYIKTEPKTVCKIPKIKPVSVLVSRNHVDEVWDREMGTVAEMVVAATAKSAHDLPPNTLACGDYGGCAYREKCGVLPELSSGFGFGNKKQQREGAEMGNAFLEKMKKAGGTPTNGEVAETAPVKKAPLWKKPATATAPAPVPEAPAGVLSADAPSRETTPEEAAELRGEADTKEKKKRGRKPKSTNGDTRKEFALYIDCMPVKDVNSDSEPTLFEDFFNPLVMQMNETAMAQKKMPSYLLLPYSEEKAMVQMAVHSMLDKLPSAMIVMSGIPGAKDALGQLTPHATLVVRGR
jgi:hypothetical protein